MTDTFHTDVTRLRSLTGRHAAVASAFLRGLCGEARPRAIAKASSLSMFALTIAADEMKGAFGEAAIALDDMLGEQEARRG